MIKGNAPSSIFNYLNFKTPMTAPLKNIGGGYQVERMKEIKIVTDKLGCEYYGFKINKCKVPIIPFQP